MTPAPPWLLLFLIVVLVFLLVVTAFIAQRRGVPAMVFLAVNISAVGVVIGRLVERRRGRPEYPGAGAGRTAAAPFLEARQTTTPQ